MSPILKILAGALMMVLGVFTSITYSNQLVEIVQGGIGPLLVLVGAFIVWLESDELKVRRQESGQQTSEVKSQQTLESRVDQSKEKKTREAAQDIKQAVSSESSTFSPEQILSGTVREVKEEVSDRDEIDVQELLEAEKSGKNRKTLINYLERQMD
jgi:hypothetical protein